MNDAEVNAVRELVTFALGAGLIGGLAFAVAFSFGMDVGRWVWRRLRGRRAPEVSS